MRQTARRVPLILCLLGIFSAENGHAQGHAADEAAIRDLAKSYMEAREKNDPAALEKLFTADADQLVSSGEWRKGRAQMVKGTLASSRNSGGRRTITLESIRFVTADTAIADGRYELTGLSTGPDRRMWTTLVAVRTPQGWKIAAIRNMLPAPPTP